MAKDLLEQFGDIVTTNASLAQRTCFKTGGAADYLASPNDVEQLRRLVQFCRAADLPFRVLGGGSNILVPDDGYHGLVIELDAPAFRTIEVDRTLVRAGAGAPLAELISESCKAGLSGLEVLAGIPGTVGGAVQKNAGGRAGDVGQFIHSVEIVNAEGKSETLGRSAVRFGYRQSDLVDAVIVAATVQLVPDKPEDVVRRIKKVWIRKQSNQPFGFQNAGYAFRNPRGLSAAELLEKAGVRGTKVGGAEISDRDPRYVVANPGATSRDVRQLMELVVQRVEEQTGVRLELHVDVW
jgi:UDP-N-acetylmuramate dehydrogenase